MKNSLLPSVLRTVVPVVVGYLLTLGVISSSVDEPTLTTAVTGVVTVAYYVVVRLVETYVSPKFGWLLGYAKTPEYGQTDSGDSGQ